MNITEEIRRIDQQQISRVNKALNAIAAIGRFSDKFASVTADRCNGVNANIAISSRSEELLKTLNEIEWQAVFQEDWHHLDDDINLKRRAKDCILDFGHVMAITYLLKRLLGEACTLISNELPDDLFRSIDHELVTMELYTIREIIKMTIK